MFGVHTVAKWARSDVQANVNEMSSCSAVFFLALENISLICWRVFISLARIIPYGRCWELRFLLAFATIILTFQRSLLRAGCCVKMIKKREATHILTGPEFFNFLIFYFFCNEKKSILLSSRETKSIFRPSFFYFQREKLISSQHCCLLVEEGCAKTVRRECSVARECSKNRRRSLAPPTVQFVYCNLIKIVRLLSYRFIFPKCAAAAAAAMHIVDSRELQPTTTSAR